MKDFELQIKYDEFLEELSISDDNYWWHSYVKIKTIDDIVNAIKEHLKELKEEMEEEENDLR